MRVLLAVVAVALLSHQARASECQRVLDSAHFELRPLAYPPLDAAIRHVQQVSGVDVRIAVCTPSGEMESTPITQLVLPEPGSRAYTYAIIASMSFVGKLSESALRGLAAHEIAHIVAGHIELGSEARKGSRAAKQRAEQEADRIAASWVGKEHVGQAIREIVPLEIEYVVRVFARVVDISEIVFTAREASTSATHAVQDRLARLEAMQ